MANPLDKPQFYPLGISDVNYKEYEAAPWPQQVGPSKADLVRHRENVLATLEDVHHGKGTPASKLVKDAEILFQWVMTGATNDPLK